MEYASRGLLRVCVGFFERVEPPVNGIEAAEQLLILRAFLVFDLNQRRESDATLAGNSNKQEKEEVLDSRFHKSIGFAAV